MNAETRIASTSLMQYFTLQWGRVLMNAETVQGGKLYKRYMVLQWGRVLMNAETCVQSDSTLLRRTASMGPRSHERGNMPNSSPPTPPKLLQWGRVLMNAETSSPYRGNRSSACFNGAAFS